MNITLAELKEWLTYDPDTGVLRHARIGTVKVTGKRKVGDQAGCVDDRGYRRMRIMRKTFLAHRLAWLWCYGELPPKGVDIDHINGDRDDNRIENLRLATRAQNNQNQKRRPSASGVKGVHIQRGGRFSSCITPPNGNQMYLGTFDTKEAAHEAYNAAARKHFGEYARSE